MKKGFTFVEMLIVVTIIGLILPAFFSIVHAILRQQVRIQHMSEIKRDGDNVLALVKNRISERNLRVSRTNRLTDPDNPDNNENYRSVNEACDLDDVIYQEVGGGSDQLFFIADSGNLDQYFRFFFDPATESIKYESNEVSGGIDVTSQDVRISNFAITCRFTSIYGAPFVGIHFVVTNRDRISPDQPELSLYYSTKIKMRTR